MTHVVWFALGLNTLALLFNLVFAWCTYQELRWAESIYRKAQNLFDRVKAITDD